MTTPPTPLVSVEELGIWLRSPLVGDDAAWAGLIITAVSSLIRSEAGQTWDGVDVPEPVRAVAFTVAARVFRNPDAATQKSTTRGPFGESVTFADPTAVGLYLSDRERKMVGKLNAKRSALWTLGTTRSDPSLQSFSVPVVGGGSIEWYNDDVEL